MIYCHYCQRKTLPRSAGPHPLALTRDHYIPVSRGGLNIAANFRRACNACNQLKGNMMPEEWESFMNDNPAWWLRWESMEIAPKIGAPFTKKASAAALRSMTAEENARRIAAYLAAHGETLFPDDERYKRTYGKKAYLSWVARGRPTPPYELRRLKADEPIPIGYPDDPKKQAAFEAVYKDRKWLLRVPIWVPKDYYA